MKKKFLPILLCICIGCGAALFGCGGDSFSKIKVSGKQDTSYAVTSQGGMAVQYGNYVYFINGYSGYEDSNGKNNTWPNVVKGGLYRAELCGDAVQSAQGKRFSPKANEAGSTVTDGLEFKASKGVDYDGNDADVINVQRIAPKKIGTSGYKDGGIFLFDNWVYFASPNNEKNKSGTVQVTKTDFFRAKLDGSEVQKIYTTSASGNESSPYAFYKYAGSTYLVAKDGSDVVSVKIDKKPADKVTIAKNVTTVILPYSDTYYSGICEHTLDSFVFIQRAVGDGDLQKAGNVIEVMRPDGKEGGIFLSQGKSDTLEAVRDDMLFYRTTDDSGNTLINYDSLHAFLSERSPSYKAYQDKIAGYAESTDEAEKQAYRNARTQINGTLLSTSSISDYTSTYCFRPDKTGNQVFLLGFKSGSVELKSNLRATATVLDAAATFVSLHGEYVYFTDSDGSVLYRTRWDTAAGDKTEAEKKEQVSHTDTTANIFNGDYCAGYIVYTGKVDNWADAYTFFKQVDRVEGAETLFVGKKISADEKPADADEEEEAEADDEA